MTIHNFNGSTDYVTNTPECIKLTLTHPTLIHKTLLDKVDLSNLAVLTPSISVGSFNKDRHLEPLMQPFETTITLLPQEILIIITHGHTTMHTQTFIKNKQCLAIL